VLLGLAVHDHALSRGHIPPLGERTTAWPPNWLIPTSNEVLVRSELLRKRRAMVFPARESPSGESRSDRASSSNPCNSGRVHSVVPRKCLIDAVYRPGTRNPNRCQPEAEAVACLVK
jgi:hypothetical protein